MKDFVTQYWLTIVVAVYLVGMVLYGHYRGFIRQAVSVVALVASIVIVNLASPYVKTCLLENEGIQTMVKDGITSALAGEDGFALDPEEERQPAVQRAYIEELPLPDQIKDLLIENNNSEVYSLLGVDRFADYLSSYIMEMIVSAVSYILVFLIVYVLLHIFMGWLDLVARLPVISGINQIAGAVLGLAQALLLIWIAGVVLTIFSTTSWAQAVFDQIAISPLLTFLYNNNILARLAISILYRL